MTGSARSPSAIRIAGGRRRAGWRSAPTTVASGRSISRCGRDTFLRIGGFDERYAGYGGEDTDFGKTLDRAGVAIAWIKGGLAYHQYHPHHMPPVHHLDSVVRNAQLFEAKWGYRTMGHWLHAFRLMGLIDDTVGQPIRILRRPHAGDLALTGQQSHQPYANTAQVVRQLEAMVAEAAEQPHATVAA
ncbi:MAG: galactosyltransferase-related protein [Sphingomonas taxi]